MNAWLVHRSQSAALRNQNMEIASHHSTYALIGYGCQTSTEILRSKKCSNAFQRRRQEVILC